jgi:cell division protein FtsW
MGEQLTMTTQTSASRLRPVKRFFRDNFDLPLGIAVVTLLSFGFLMVYSASWQYAVGQGNSAYSVVLKQILFALLGGGLAIFLTFFDYHRFRSLVVLGMAGIILLLLAVLIFGSTGDFGAKRALFNGSFQPSEFAKLMIVIYLSVWLNSKRDVMDQWTFGLIPLMGILGVTAGLILAQPDVSAAATVVVLGGVLFFIAGGKLRQILVVVFVASVLGALVVLAYPTARVRVTDYWNGMQNPENASDHVKWSLEAIINGGVFGAGLGRSTTKFIGLPVAPTDSIFAVIAEETGILGAIFVIALYLVILWRGIKIASEARDDLGKWIASGVTLWIIIEATINMGVIVNLLPFAGNALPLVSSGGSSMLTVMMGIGILMGVARNSKQPKTASEGSPHGKVADLRRGNGRRSVSGPVRPSSYR